MDRRTFLKAGAATAVAGPLAVTTRPRDEVRHAIFQECDIPDDGTTYVQCQFNDCDLQRGSDTASNRYIDCLFYWPGVTLL